MAYLDQHVYFKTWPVLNQNIRNVKYIAWNIYEKTIEVFDDFSKTLK